MPRLSKTRAAEVAAVAQFRAADPAGAEQVNDDLQAVLAGNVTAAQLIEKEKCVQDSLRRELAEVQQACRELAAVFKQAQEQSKGYMAENMAMLQLLTQGPAALEDGAGAVEEALRVQVQAAPNLRPLEEQLAREAPELFRALGEAALFEQLGLVAPEPARGPADAPGPAEAPEVDGRKTHGQDMPPKPSRKGRARRSRRAQHVAD